MPMRTALPPARPADPPVRVTPKRAGDGQPRILPSGLHTIGPAQRTKWPTATSYGGQRTVRLTRPRPSFTRI